MTCGPELEDERAQRPCRHHVEAVRRLVEQQVPWRMHECAGERDLDALALRVTLGPAIGKAADLEFRDQLVNTPRKRIGIEAVQPPK